MGYLPVALGGFDNRKSRSGSGSDDDSNGHGDSWTSYDASALDWDPEEARVKRRLIATEKRKDRITSHVKRLDRQLTARRQELEMADAQSAQLTARLDSARGAGGVLSMMGGVANDLTEGSPQLAAVDAAGQQAFGEKWTKGENGGPPLRTLLSLAPEDLRQIKEGLATAREERIKEKRIKKKKKKKNKREKPTIGRHLPNAAPALDPHEEYNGHSDLLARTSALAERLRNAAKH